MILHIVRIVFLLVVLAITVSYALQEAVYSKGPEFITVYVLIPAVIALVAVLVDMFWKHKRLQVLSGLFFGVLAGLVIAYMLTLVLELVMALFPAPLPAPPPGELPREQQVAALGLNPTTQQTIAYQHAKFETRQAHQEAIKEHNKATEAYLAYSAYTRTVQLIKLLLGAAAVFICVSFVLQTKDDFRFVIPYVEFSKETKGARPILLDTSVIIDGRIADIAETRMLESTTIVPRFILAELQSIADSDDKLKRNRGRRGLDILNRLQGSDKLDIQILDAHVASVDEAADVDAKLVALAEHLGGRIVTNDYNLNKVAQLKGVDVININDLANALKPIVLPGEAMTVKIIKAGEEPGQGVGYLEDGTMVVAEQGRDCIGREIAITVTSILQTSAGRMIFGKMDADKTFSQGQRRTT